MPNLRAGTYLKSLVAHFAGAKGLRRLVVQCQDGVVEQEFRETTQARATIASKRPVAPGERGPITADDIIRVHELLTTAANVDEFLRSISMPKPGAR